MLTVTCEQDFLSVSLWSRAPGRSPAADSTGNPRQKVPPHPGPLGAVPVSPRPSLHLREPHLSRPRPALILPGLPPGLHHEGVPGRESSTQSRRPDPRRRPLQSGEFLKSHPKLTDNDSGGLTTILYQNHTSYTYSCTKVLK